jgi:citrate lyase subunit beta/citryl-CoA lyase
VPANRPELFAKAVQAGADAVILDLEDAVPAADRSPARVHVAEFLGSSGGAGATHRFVRVNPCATRDFLADIDAAVQPGLLGVILPKVESPGEVVTAAQALSRYEERRNLPAGSVRIVPVLETAMGIRLAFEIASASARVAYMGGITARGGDVERAIGYRWSASGLETLAMRSQVLIDVRAAKVPNPTTGVWTDIADLAGLRSFAESSRDLGYEGMIVIHPSHVPVVNEVFSPDADEQRRYARLVAVYEQAERLGKAAVMFEGQMIDTAMARTARERLESR